MVLLLFILFPLLSLRPVKIVRLIGSNTVEEIILRRAEVKLKLTERVVEEGQFAILPQKDSKLSLITDNKVKVITIKTFEQHLTFIIIFISIYVGSFALYLF